MIEWPRYYITAGINLWAKLYCCGRQTHLGRDQISKIFWYSVITEYCLEIISKLNVKKNHIQFRFIYIFFILTRPYSEFWTVEDDGEFTILKNNNKILTSFFSWYFGHFWWYFKLRNKKEIQLVKSNGKLQRRNEPT